LTELEATSVDASGAVPIPGGGAGPAAGGSASSVSSSFLEMSQASVTLQQAVDGMPESTMDSTIASIDFNDLPESSLNTPGLPPTTTGTVFSFDVLDDLPESSMDDEGVPTVLLTNATPPAHPPSRMQERLENADALKRSESLSSTGSTDSSSSSTDSGSSSDSSGSSSSSSSGSDDDGDDSDEEFWGTEI